MRAVVQRVLGAKLHVDGKEISSINKGLVVFWGLEIGDTEKDLDYLAEKLIGLRVFPDAQDKMNLSVAEVSGEVMLVSQFTLLGDVRRGRRPGFDSAMAPGEAKIFFEKVIKKIQLIHDKTVTGIFGADMEILVNNWGPVTILMDSRKCF